MSLHKHLKELPEFTIYAYTCRDKRGGTARRDSWEVYHINKVIEVDKEWYFKHLRKLKDHGHRPIEISSHDIDQYYFKSLHECLDELDVITEEIKLIPNI